MKKFFIILFLVFLGLVLIWIAKSLSNKSYLVLVNNDEVVKYNLNKERVEIKQKLNTTGLIINSWLGCSQNVQITRDGKVLFYAGEDPKQSDIEAPYIVSKLFLSPNRMIYSSDETRGDSFCQWMISNDDSNLYLASKSGSTNKTELIEVSLITGKQRIVTKDFGTLEAPLYLDKKNEQVFSFFREEKVVNTIYEHNVYQVSVDLKSGNVNKKFIYKEKMGSFPFFGVSSWKPNPSLNKIAAIDRINNSFTLVVMDLASGKRKELLQFNEFWNRHLVQWSKNGRYILLVGSTTTVDTENSQKIWVIDTETGLSSLLVNITSKNFNDFLDILDGEFDGRTFLYHKNKRIYSYDIKSQKSKDLKIDGDYNYGKFIKTF